MTDLIIRHNHQRIELDGDQIKIGRLWGEIANGLDKTLAHRIGDWLYLPQIFIAKHHANLFRNEDGSYSIEDAGSRSGTFVNGILVRERQVLKHSDEIAICQVWIDVCVG